MRCGWPLLPMCAAVASALSGAPLVHHAACCITPPDDGPAWRAVQAARLDLRDAGLYRWPPHANLIYPFSDDPRGAAVALRRACRTVAPFRVRLAETGVFGGRRRGVLWLRPEVARGAPGSLATLQARLCGALALETPDARSKSLPFVPHVTLAHFSSADAARAAGDALAFDAVEFDVDAVTLVVRDGADGQFEIAETVPLGRAPFWRLRRLARRALGRAAPRRFAGMPKEPYAWTKAAMDGRRRSRFSANGERRRKRRRSPSERAAIAARTDQEIAAIRAARAAKRAAGAP